MLTSWLVEPGTLPDLWSPTTVSAGGWLLVIVAVITAMLRGWLVPGTQVDRLVRAYEATIADRDQQIRDWRDAARLSEQRADLSAKNQERLLDGVATTNQLVESLAKVVQDGGGRS